MVDSQSFTSYEVDNDKRFRDALAKVSEVSTDLRVPFGLILRDFYKSEQSIAKLSGPGLYPPFKHSTEKFGKTGRKLKTNTISDKSPYQLKKIKKYGRDYPLLVATGKLMASVLGPNNPGSIANITKLALVFGTSVEYGIYHQSDEKRTKIPLRKFLFIGPEAKRFANSNQIGRLERWLGILSDHFDSKIKEAGLK